MIKSVSCLTFDNDDEEEEEAACWTLGSCSSNSKLFLGASTPIIYTVTILHKIRSNEREKEKEGYL